MDFTASSLIALWLDSRCPLRGLPTLRAGRLLVLYAAAVCILGWILPGRNVQGTLLTDGTRLSYKCNGLATTFVFLLAGYFAWSYGFFEPASLVDMAGELFITTLVLSLAISALLYIVGASSTSKSASLKARLTGNIVVDFWLGTQLNPSFLGLLDLKWFLLRLGMLGWLLIDLSAAAKMLDLHGTISSSMLLFQAFWLLIHNPAISPAYAASCVVTFALGYAIFRGANMQKHVFKKDPTQKIWGATPRVVGGRLLASGYWGLARHCNYLGDIVLALSFSLPCAFSSAVPYFYPIYLFLLLVWRERRDEARCRAKYREVWEEYCSLVPWRICPGIY